MLYSGSPRENHRIETNVSPAPHPLPTHTEATNRSHPRVGGVVEEHRHVQKVLGVVRRHAQVQVHRDGRVPVPPGQRALVGGRAKRVCTHEHQRRSVCSQHKGPAVNRTIVASWFLTLPDPYMYVSVNDHLAVSLYLSLILY